MRDAVATDIFTPPLPPLQLLGDPQFGK